MLHETLSCLSEVGFSLPSSVGSMSGNTFSFHELSYLAVYCRFIYFLPTINDVYITTFEMTESVFFAHCYPVAPRILVPPEDLTVVSPNNAMFFCQATARPGPAITWWRRRESGSLNQIMATMGEYTITNVEMGERVRSSTLVIVGSEPFDTGEYLCQAENVVSVDFVTANLTVYGKNTRGLTQVESIILLLFVM